MELWDIRSALGSVVADGVIVNAQFRFAPDTTFRGGAATTVDTGQRRYGAAAAKVRTAFAARGLL